MRGVPGGKELRDLEPKCFNVLMTGIENAKIKKPNKEGFYLYPCFAVIKIMLGGAQKVSRLYWLIVLFDDGLLNSLQSWYCIIFDPINTPSFINLALHCSEIGTE